MNHLPAFEAANPDIAAWWKDSTFPFAASLRDFAGRKGFLTPAQKDAALRCIERYKAAQASTTDARAVDVGGMERVFAVALAKGLRRPRLNIGEYVFSPVQQGVNAKGKPAS